MCRTAGSYNSLIGSESDRDRLCCSRLQARAPVSQGTDMKIACLDDSVHLFVHRQFREEVDTQQLNIIHDRYTGITNFQTCVGRALGKLQSCTKSDLLGLACIEQQPISKEPASHFLNHLNSLDVSSDDRTAVWNWVSSAY